MCAKHIVEERGVQFDDAHRPPKVVPQPPGKCLFHLVEDRLFPVHWPPYCHADVSAQSHRYLPALLECLFLCGLSVWLLFYCTNQEAAPIGSSPACKANMDSRSFREFSTLPDK